MIFNFVVLNDYENISTTKISGFTVLYVYTVSYFFPFIRYPLPNNDSDFTLHTELAKCGLSNIIIGILVATCVHGK